MDATLEVAAFDSACPAICMAAKCNYTADYERDQDAGWCEVCEATTQVVPHARRHDDGPCQDPRNQRCVKGHRPELGRMITSGARELINAWPLAERMLINQVRRFETFTEDNDPWNEHDCFEFLGERVFWKIDYMDKDMEYGSENPAGADRTCRVMTIALLSEY